MAPISCYDGEIKTLQLDPAGDAVLVVHHPTEESRRRFLVSTRTLSLASPYFKTLFGSSFKESKETQQGTYPDINLEEDDPAAMEILLSILHFRNLDKYIYLRPQILAEVAVASDKYDCVSALVPWACQWFHDVAELDRSEDYGFLLTAAFLLRSEEYFRAISVTAVRHMERGFLKNWSKHEIIGRLPSNLKDSIANLMLSTLDSIQNKLFSVEEPLRGNQSKFRLYHPRDPSDQCTATYRVADYVLILRMCDLGLSISGFRSGSISIVMDRIKKASKSQRHECWGADKCPLLLQLADLPGRLEDVIKNTEGVSINSFADKK